MNDITKLIEELNGILEDTLEDDFEDIEISDDHLDTNTEDSEEVEVEDIDVEEDKTNVTDELEAKTKISRALDVLIKAVDDFKNATASEVDLLKDTEITTNIEVLDDTIHAIQAYVAGSADVISDEAEAEIEGESEDTIEDTSVEVEEEPEQEDIDFEAEASLDLFPADKEE